MRYQLVLKFQDESLVDCRRLAALFDDLIEAVGESAEIDNHHWGSGGTNIFMWTNDPQAIFQRIKPVLEGRGQLEGLTVGYRAAESKGYTVIWPDGAAPGLL